MAGALGRRKIIQIAVAAPGEGDQCSVIYALADDGTLWAKADTEGTRWEQVPPLPHREHAPERPRPQ